MNPFFNWLKDSGTQGMLVLLSTIAAGLAAYFGWKAPSKKDLHRVEDHTAATSEKLADVECHLAAVKEDIKRVEGHTANTTGHLENVHSELAAMNRRIDTQQERDALNARINRVALRVMGDVEQGKEAVFSITKKDENVVLNRVELYNEWGTKYGTAPCEELAPPNQVVVNLHSEAFKAWYHAGSVVSGSLDRNLYIRVFFTFNGFAEEVSRRMAVSAKIVHKVELLPAPTTVRLFGEV